MNVGEHEVDTMWVADFYGVEIDDTVDFQLSQRADHIVNTVSSRVRFTAPSSIQNAIRITTIPICTASMSCMVSRT